MWLERIHKSRKESPLLKVSIADLLAPANTALEIPGAAARKKFTLDLVGTNIIVIRHQAF
jgi:hypothetical protein